MDLRVDRLSILTFARCSELANMAGDVTLPSCPIL